MQSRARGGGGGSGAGYRLLLKVPVLLASVLISYALSWIHIVLKFCCEQVNDATPANVFFFLFAYM